MAIVLVCMKRDTVTKLIGDIITWLPADHRFSDDEIKEFQFITIANFSMEEWKVFFGSFKPEIKKVYQNLKAGWTDIRPAKREAWNDNGQWKLLAVDNYTRANIAALSEAIITALADISTPKATILMLLGGITFPFKTKPEHGEEITIG